MREVKIFAFVLAFCAVGVAFSFLFAGAVLGDVRFYLGAIILILGAAAFVGIGLLANRLEGRKRA